MEFKIYQVDSFTSEVFGGNPACVVPLESWLDDSVLLKIARENSVAETAFFIASGDRYRIRWFTPDIEMDLCGHATLAAAHVLKKYHKLDSKVIQFESNSGILTVTCQSECYTLDLPSRMPVAAILPEIIENGIEPQPREVFKARDYMLMYDKEEDITNIKLNRQILDQINLDPGGIIITAPGNMVDFVSRYFTTQSTIFEDPVTGSAHCSLIPFWSKRLNKNEMTARQLSSRGGELVCVNADSRVLITGNAKTYMEGVILIQ
ncbi:PhzF family phenazine biosynthesis protein [soil metagenome]